MNNKLPPTVLQRSLNEVLSSPEDIKSIQAITNLPLTKLGAELGVTHWALRHYKRGDRHPQPLVFLCLKYWAEELRNGSAR